MNLKLKLNYLNLFNIIPLRKKPKRKGFKRFTCFNGESGVDIACAKEVRLHVKQCYIAMLKKSPHATAIRETRTLKDVLKLASIDIKIIKNKANCNIYFAKRIFI